MIRFNLWVLSLLCASGAFKVMNLNMFDAWRSHHNVKDGIRKFADIIKSVNADIVTLQEAGPIKIIDKGNNETVNSLSKYLGSEWSIVKHCQRDMAIVTKHQILGLYEHTSTGVNVRVRINETAQEISVWSVNLHELNYGPYLAAEKKNRSEVLEGEYEKTKYKGRLHNIADLMIHKEFVQQIANSRNIPVIVAGGFNTPSHLDWIEETKDTHYGYSVAWPVTRHLTGIAGMTDSYREVHPDPKKDPGNTWSLYKKSNGKIAPKDRIDYIFYSGAIKPKSSITYNTTVVDEDGADWKDSEWPSDHKAVITDFENTSQKKNKRITKFTSEFLEEHGTIEPITKCALNIIH